MSIINTTIFSKPRTKTTALALSLSLLSTAAVGASATFSLSSETVGFDYTTKIPERPLFGSVHFLHKEDQGDVFGASFNVIGRSQLSTGNQHTGMGAKFLGINTDSETNPSADYTGAVMAVGGFVRHNFTNADLITFHGSAYYAPSVVSFGDIDGYLEIEARAEYQIIDQASAFLGYRLVDIDAMTDEAEESVEFDSSAFVGMRMEF